MTDRRVASCVWFACPEVIAALDGRFGDPHDAYVNGSQVWLRDDGPPVVGADHARLTVEWRLHPVGGYGRPAGLGTHEVFPAVALALGTGRAPPAPLVALWDGLEAFAAYGEEAYGEEADSGEAHGEGPRRGGGFLDGEQRVAALRTATTEALGLPPDAWGLVDHDVIGAEWERSGRRSSIVGALLRQLGDPRGLTEPAATVHRRQPVHRRYGRT